jgi:RNA polymerase sigma-70 factor (ECF subfamily)
MREFERQSRAQRQAAFERVVTRYESPLLRYVTRIVCDEALAQDIVQDSFLKLLRKWDGPMEEGARISSWLYRVAHNRAVDAVRRQSRRRSLHHRHAAELPTSVPPDRGEGADVTDRALAAVDALQMLSERERQLVVLKVFEEKSYKEIAEIAGVSVGNVGYILHHAMRKLAEHLGCRGHGGRHGR